MPPTTVLLNYKGYGQIERLSCALRSRGRHITMIAHKDTTVSQTAFDEILFCDNLLDYRCVQTIIKHISNNRRIDDIVNNTSFPAYVHYHALREFGDRFKRSEWMLNARIKPECRRLLNRANVGYTKYVIVNNESELKTIEGTLGFPCVIKPAGGQGSDHVYKVLNWDELKNKYGLMLKKTIEGVCHDTNSDIEVNGTRYDLTRNIIVEKYIPGTEYTVDGYVHNGRAVVVAVHEKCFSEETADGFRDHFYITPPKSWSGSTPLEVMAFVQSVCSVLKMNTTLFHIEIRINNGEIKIVEVNPRIGGGTIYDNVLLSTGVSLTDIYADMLCNMPVTLNTPRQDGVVFGFGATIPKCGTVVKIDGMHVVKSIAGVKHVHLAINVGDRFENLVGERYALVITGQTKSHSEAFDVYNKVNQEFKIDME